MVLHSTEFQRRVAENTITFNKEIAEKSFTPSNYHFFEKDRNDDKKLFEFENAWDIMGAALVGDLPSNKPYGADGYRLQPNPNPGHAYNHTIYIPMEYKISRRKSNSIWKSPRDALYIGKSNVKDQNSCLRSSFEASFEIVNNLYSKNRLTILFVFDSTTDQFVSGFELPGSNIVARLNNGRSGKSRGIKLSAFINEGKEIKNNFTLSPELTFTGSYFDWEERLKENVCTLQRGDLCPENTLRFQNVML